MKTPERSDQYDGSFHYLPVDDAAMSWGMYLTGLGRGIVPVNVEYPPPGHPKLYEYRYNRGRVLPEFQLVLISEGNGVFESAETGEVKLDGTSLFILFPGVWHRFRPELTTGWHERWISFNGEMTHRLMDLRLLSPNYAVRSAGDSSASLIETFDALIDRVFRSPNQNSVLLSLHAMSLLGQVLDAMPQPGNVLSENYTVREKQVEDPLVAGALNLIWTHSDRAFSIKDFADRLFVSRRVLERRFRAELGHTMLEEITACRLSRAKRLLRETQLGIAAIADLSGFPSEERMRVVFHAKEKMAPSEYRDSKLAERKLR